MKRILTTASAALLALGTAASASTFSLVGGTPGVIPGGSATNEVLTNTFSMAGALGEFGAQVYLDGDADIEVAVFGFEAGFANQFSITGGGVTDGFDTEVIDTAANGVNQEYAADEASPLDSFTLTSVTAGLLDFSFITNGLGGSTVNNGANPDNLGNNANFFASFGGGSANSSIFLFFDDGGAENDDNHDDLVVRLTVGAGNTTPSPVPLPATGLLLLGALGGMRMMKRRS